MGACLISTSRAIEYVCGLSGSWQSTVISVWKVKVGCGCLMIAYYCVCPVMDCAETDIINFMAR